MNGFRKHIAALCFVFALVLKLNATHLVGGFISYEYVGTSSFGARYTITITSYRDCKTGAIPYAKNIDVCVYQRSDLKLYKTFNFTLQSTELVKPVGRTDCPEATQVCLEKGIYRNQIDLPTSSYGYFVKWEVCCRNTQVNLKNDMSGVPFIGQTYQTIIPPTNVKNSSPYFTDVPVPFICINDTAELSNYAVDPDGDSLVYKLATPWYGASYATNYPGCTPTYNAPVPISPIDYEPGYNGNIPFGVTGISQINSSSGVATFKATKTGNYAVALDLLEYRGGVLLSSTRLDLQILVINCSPNTKPYISTSSKNYTVMAGDKLCFNVVGSDKDKQNLTLNGFGDLLTGANGFIGNKATFSPAFANTTVTSQFCWQTSCNQARTQPYVFTARVVDDGCPSKFTMLTVNITVQPFTGKSTLTGPLTACEGAKGVQYTINTTANTPAELIGVTHQVTVTGGTLVSVVGNKVIVNWNTGLSSGTISVQAVSKFGCLGAKSSININLVPAPATPNLKAFDTVCVNSNGTYAINNTAGYTYQWWINNGTIQGASNTNSIAVVWGNPGKAWAKVVQYNANGCPSDTALLQVWVSKPAIPQIVGKPSVCPNTKQVLYTIQTPNPKSAYKWFVWGGSIQSSPNSSSILVNWGNPGIGLVKVLELNAYGCSSDTGYFNVDKNYTLSVDQILGDTDVCANTFGEIYQVANAPNTVYHWAVIGGNIVSGQGTYKVAVDWAGASTAQISLYETSYDSVNNKNCVSNLVSRTVNIRLNPSAKMINGVFEVCQSNWQSTYTVNGMPGSSYVWSINGDTANIKGQGSSTISLSYKTAGSFIIKVIETSGFGCPGLPILDTLIIHPKPSTSAILGDSIICANNTLNFNYSVVGASSSTYTWSILGGTLKTINKNAVVVDWFGQANNWLKVVEMSDYQCLGDTQTLKVYYDNPYLYLDYITVNPPPASDKGIDAFWHLVNAPMYKQNFEVQKRVAGSSAPFATVGTVSAGNFKFNDAPTMNDSSAWEYRIKGSDLCGNVLFTNVHTNILLKGYKTTGYDVFMYFTPYLGWSNAQVKYDVFRWLPTSNTYELYEPQINGFSTLYSNGLEAYTQCYRIRGNKVGTDTFTWSNEVCFNFEPVLFVPNAFSPNKDDLNERFGVKGGALKSVELHVFNRWGEEVFIGKDISETWDGTYKNQEQPQDVYMYYCNYVGFDGRHYTARGTVTLLR